MSELTPETMPLDQLRALIEANGLPLEAQDTLDVTPATPAAKPRDENGRFTKQEETQEEVVYQRVIDLGDGSGVQIFEAPTMEELVDKLATAQENATRKIREQALQIKSAPVKDEPAPVEELTEEQKFLLQQEMLADPLKVINRYVDKAVNANKRVQAAAEHADAQKQKEESDAFVASTPDYFVHPSNAQKMVKYLELNQLEVTQENLKAAFTDLNTSGLLVAKPESETAAPAGEGEQTQETVRIEQKTTPATVVRRRVVGGVSMKRSAPVEQAPKLTEAELYKMPLHELEQLYYKQGL